jgi:hypothetical protein
MIRILLDPAAPADGEFDHAFQLATIIEAEVFRSLGRNHATINSTRRGPIVPTKRQRKQQIDGWMPDVVVPISLADEGQENVRVTKTAGCCVEYLPVVIEKAIWAYPRQELEDILEPYYALADAFCAAVKKTYASEFPAPEPVAEEPVAEEPAAEETVDAPEATTEPSGS